MPTDRVSDPVDFGKVAGKSTEELQRMAHWVAVQVLRRMPARTPVADQEDLAQDAALEMVLGVRRGMPLTATGWHFRAAILATSTKWARAQAVVSVSEHALEHGLVKIGDFNRRHDRAEKLLAKMAA